jgi:hypothetical protein
VDQCQPRKEGVPRKDSHEEEPAELHLSMHLALCSTTVCLNEGHYHVKTHRRATSGLPSHNDLVARDDKAGPPLQEKLVRLGQGEEIHVKIRGPQKRRGD